MQIPVSKATKRAIARSVHRSELEEKRKQDEAMTDPNHHAEMEAHHAAGVERGEKDDLIARMAAALEAAEKADQQHMKCDECDPEDAPEICAKCFPLADDARLMRRAILESLRR